MVSYLRRPFGEVSFSTIDKSDKIGISPNIFDEFNKLES